jgi:hypothetical protein
MDVECKIFRGTEITVRYVSLDATLAQMRAQLGTFMRPNDLFVYYDERQQCRMPQPRNAEARYLLKSIMGEGEQITIFDPYAPKADLQGELVQWFSDRELDIGVSLNHSNPDAQRANEGKFEPFLLRNLTPISDSVQLQANILFPQAVICEQGSAISFTLACWGAAGYAYAIESERVKIVPSEDPIYCGNNGDYGSVTLIELDHFADYPTNIIVSSLGSQAIALTDKAQYSRVTVTVWNMVRYQMGKQTYESYLRPQMVRSLATTRSSIVPGSGIESGSAHAGGSNPHTLGVIQNPVLDRNLVLGRIELYFLVFDQRTTVQQMILQNNIPIPW